jgi:hypothetical protein
VTTMIEPYESFGPRGEFVLATEDQLTGMDDAQVARYQRLAECWNRNVAADKALADCEQELHQVVAASRALDSELAALPRISQHTLVMQMRECNR